MKSEPDAYSWQRLVKEGKTTWDGVRNYQARNHMQAMKLGDRAFFYHSNEAKGFMSKAVVGIMEIVREAYPDPGDERFVMVDVVPVKALAAPVPLAALKAEPKLSGMAMLRQSRLSVSPLTAAEWKAVLALSGTTA